MNLEGIVKYLIDNNYIKRVGAKKKGEWIINRDIGGKKTNE